MKRHKENKRKVAASAQCPCGSGKPYSKCCEAKRFTWLEDREGKYYRSVPMHPVLQSIFREKRRNFKRIFGRFPRDDDPVFFDEVDPVAARAMSTELMLKSGISPALVYAHDKTGLIVTEFNKDLIPDIDLDEWNSAIEEYKTISLKRAKRSPREIAELRKWSKLEPSLRDMLTVGRMMLLEYGQAKNLSDARKIHSLNDMFFLCVAKGVKSASAVLKMGEEGFGEDALTVCRSMLESYFTMSFLLRNPERVDDIVSCVVALTAGEAEERFVKINGTKTRVVVERGSGAVIGRSVSVWEKAKSGNWPEDIDLYKITYSYFSDFAHPSIYSIEAYLREDGGFNVFGKEKVLHAYLYGSFCLLLILDALRFSKALSDVHRRDMQKANLRFARVLTL